MSEALIENRWYWVRLRAPDTYVDPLGTGYRDEWFPALYAPRAVGGWTNGDCWEDFDREVIEWRLIPLPE